MPALIEPQRATAMTSKTLSAPGSPEHTNITTAKGKAKHGSRRFSPLGPMRPMSPLSSPVTKATSGEQPLKKHVVYYMPQGNTVIQVERTLFKVELAVLRRHSLILESITSPDGIFTDKNPLVLHEISETDFTTLLRVLYPLPTQLQPSTVEEHLALLRLAAKYAITSLIPLCTKFLHSQPLDPVRKITIWDTYTLDPTLLTSAYADLCEAPLPLGLGAATALGVRLFQRVVCAREMYKQRVGCSCCSREMEEGERRKVALEIVGVVFSSTTVVGGMERKGSLRRHAV